MATAPGGALGFSADQVRLLLLLALPLSVAPAVVVAAHARSHDHVDHPLAWALLVAATSLIGVVAYWEHCRIQEKRAGGNGEGAADGSDP